MTGRPRFYEFRPGVFVKWMDELRIDGHQWRFDTERWRPRNCTDTGFVTADSSCSWCIAAFDTPTPAWLRSAVELDGGRNA